MSFLTFHTFLGFAIFREKEKTAKNLDANGPCFYNRLHLLQFVTRCSVWVQIHMHVCVCVQDKH